MVLYVSQGLGVRSLVPTHKRNEYATGRAFVCKCKQHGHCYRMLAQTRDIVCSGFCWIPAFDLGDPSFQVQQDWEHHA